MFYFAIPEVPYLHEEQPNKDTETIQSETPLLQFICGA